ncbi:MAG: molybdenum cofactor guanylyltransferase [Azoarcus sp.]|jgi:molybdopterin-guanine dinucleotide biosynthesis protein A|nr:molybdenum cofactor guanylyltransferase [Azoarcus sp.]
MIADCTALIFAGGDSRRMGRDKLFLQIGGQSLLQRTLDLMRSLFSSILVSVQHPRDDIDAPQVCDEIPEAGPLAGLCAGLQHSTTPWVFAVAADMPYLLPEVIERLAAHRAGRQAVVPVIDGQPYPLTAFYAVSALPTLRTVLTRPGKPGLFAALPELDICRIDEHHLADIDMELRSFADLDTPEDAAEALRHFGN